MSRNGSENVQVIQKRSGVEGRLMNLEAFSIALDPRRGNVEGAFSFLMRRERERV
jgi:hypothetical protein